MSRSERELLVILGNPPWVVRPSQSAAVASFEPDPTDPAILRLRVDESAIVKLHPYVYEKFVAPWVVGLRFHTPSQSPGGPSQGGREAHVLAAPTFGLMVVRVSEDADRGVLVTPGKLNARRWGPDAESTVEHVAEAVSKELRRLRDLPDDQLWPEVKDRRGARQALRLAARVLFPLRRSGDFDAPYLYGVLHYSVVIFVQHAKTYLHLAAMSDGLRKTLIDEKRLILGIRQASHARLVATRDTADAEYKWMLDSIERLLALSTPAVRQIRRRLKVHRKGKFERQAFWGDLIAWIVRTLINGYNLGEGAACEEAAAILAKLFPSAERSAKAIRSLYYHRLGTEPLNVPR